MSQSSIRLIDFSAQRLEREILPEGAAAARFDFAQQSHQVVFKILHSKFISVEDACEISVSKEK